MHHMVDAQILKMNLNQKKAAAEDAANGVHHRICAKKMKPASVLSFGAVAADS